MEPLLYNQRPKEMFAAMLAAGRVPHALLLEGQPGSGRYTFALQIAQSLLCQGDRVPCGECAACHKVGAGIHPDVVTITRSSESKAGEIKIDQVRQLAQDAYVLPNEGRAKVYIIREAGEMNTAAQNAFLKTLEEPPAHCYFILTSRNRSALLSTILSRVQVLPMERLSISQVEQALRQLRPNLQEDAYVRAAQAGDGAVGPALEALENQGETLVQEAAHLLCLTAGAEEYALLAALAPYEGDREKLLALLEELGRQVAAAIVCSGDPMGNPPWARNPLQLFRIADIIEDTVRKVSQNGNRQLLVTLLASRLKSALGGCPGRDRC